MTPEEELELWKSALDKMTAERDHWIECYKKMESAMNKASREMYQLGRVLSASMKEIKQW